MWPSGCARYDDLLRPVADGRPDGFCKLIADRQSHHILGAHVLGDYSAEPVPVVATAMSAGMTVERLAEMRVRLPDVYRSCKHGRSKSMPADRDGPASRAVWSYSGSATE